MSLSKLIITISLLLVSLNSSAIGLAYHDLTLTTSAKYSNVINSIKGKDGFEYIFCKDTGQCLQSAINYNGIPEVNNPTQGGSRALKKSPPKYLGKSFSTIFQTNQLAYWEPVGKASISNTWLTSATTVETGDILNTQVIFFPDKAYNSAVFEALTAYMSSAFSYSIQFNPETQTFTDNWAFKGEQEFPVIFYTDDTKHAIAHYSKDLPQVMPDGQKVGYGQFKYQWTTDVLSKINCVFREDNITAKPYAFECKTIVGDLESVKATLHRLWIADHLNSTCTIPGVPQ
jgi:hypothetical protein